MSQVSFIAACGASELSANAYVVQAHGHRLLLDAGAVQGQSPDWVDQIAAPDICWVSHAHWDHLGSLGPLKARFPRLECLSSVPTRRLASIALATAGLDPQRAHALALQLRGVPMRRYVELSSILDTPAAKKFRMMVFPAGHIPGAGMVVVEIDVGGERPFRLLYTGDFCGHDQPAVPGALFPKTGADFSIDVMIMEGVLATQKGLDELDYTEQFAKLERIVGARQGGALIGVSSLGEAAQLVAGLVEAGIRPTVHRMLESVLEAAGVGLAEMDGADEAQCRQALEAGKVVIAPGEQLGRSTPAGRLVSAIAERDDGVIVVLNRAHKKSTAGRILSGRHTNLSASAEHVQLPNHAPRHQLTGAVKAIDPARVVLVHGHRSQLFALKRAIAATGFAGAIDVPENGEMIDLVADR
jgi:Cft2 family RNA processing exonuclease